MIQSHQDYSNFFMISNQFPVRLKLRKIIRDKLKHIVTVKYIENELIHTISELHEFWEKFVLNRRRRLQKN